MVGGVRAVRAKLSNRQGLLMSNWQWMGNYADAPAAVTAANQAGSGAGEAVYAANDAGTVGLYLLR